MCVLPDNSDSPISFKVGLKHFYWTYNIMQQQKYIANFFSHQAVIFHKYGHKFRKELKFTMNRTYTIQVLFDLGPNILKFFALLN